MTILRQTLNTVNTARVLKYVWPFYNIMHVRVNSQNLPSVTNFFLLIFPKMPSEFFLNIC